MSERSTVRAKSRILPGERAGRSLRAAVLLGGLLLISTGGAHAQFVFDDEILPPRVVAWRLADRGFTGLTRPRFDGRVYVVEAVSPSGAPVRLLVDPASGAIVGRRALGGPETYAGLEPPAGRPMPGRSMSGRSMPGYGWTEDDAAPRDPRPLPAEPRPEARPARRPAPEIARTPDANPYGVNPDARPRTEAPRRVARTDPARGPETKPATRSAPEAPAPKAAPEIGRSETKPEAPAAGGMASPSVAPKPDAAPRQAAAEGQTKPAPKDWKDPPAEGRRPVRVIGGATVVPGTAEKDGAASQ